MTRNAQNLGVVHILSPALSQWNDVVTLPSAIQIKRAATVCATRISQPQRLTQLHAFAAANTFGSCNFFAPRLSLVISAPTGSAGKRSASRVRTRAWGSNWHGVMGSEQAKENPAKRMPDGVCVGKQRVETQLTHSA